VLAVLIDGRQQQVALRIAERYAGDLFCTDDGFACEERAKSHAEDRTLG